MPNAQLIFKLKRLYIYLFLFLPLCLHAQILRTDNLWLQRDKLVHFSYSAGFTPALIQVLEIKGVRHPEIKGAAILFAAGVAKEFIFDDKASFKDITVNFAGCLAGIYLNRLILKVYNKSSSIGKFSPK
jgi:hypothetical protein